MELMDNASLMAAPPTQCLDFNIAPSTAVERRSHAPCRDVPPTLKTGDSVPNTAAVKRNAGFQAAQTR